MLQSIRTTRCFSASISRPLGGKTRKHVSALRCSASANKNSDSPIPAQRLGPGLAAITTTVLLAAAPAYAINAEPANALSLPTWAIHVSSVVEWVTAMFLFWKYAEVSGNERWKAMSWGMVPSLGGAMSACTWHFFYNSPDLEFLVVLQASLTIIGNVTCWMAAYHIYQGFQAEKA